MFQMKAREIGHFDVAVCGAGIAGVCAAVSAARNGAKVVLIERAGSLGGTLTEGFMPNIMDSANKGGLVKELLNFLNEHQMTCINRGQRLDENGKRIPGQLVDTEGIKYYFDKICVDAGVTVLFHSQVAAVSMKEDQPDQIDRILITTECGNYSLSAALYIDATGNGLVADYAGCSWECGDPIEKRPSPASMGICTVGFPEDYNGTDCVEDKNTYAKMLLDHNIDISAQQATVKKLPSLKTWCMGINFQYDVRPDDIFSLSDAVIGGRKELFEVSEAQKKIPGYEEMFTAFTSSHIGIREGRRIYGEYRLNDDDILEGRRFEDGVCLVTVGVDVHKLKKDDTLDCSRGYKAKPFHIPYRCLVAKECKNLMLAGRCLSGDFYPHAAYRMMGSMAATGEAVGYAAALCCQEHLLPAAFDGKRARAYMEQQGYAL